MKIYFMLFLVSLPMLTWGQHPVNGVVKNENGEALDNAHVMWMGTSVWTITDSLGTFRLNLDETAKQPHTLVVSFVGYRSDTIRWAAHTPSYLTVVLKNDNTLKDVVVRSTGTGTFFSRLDPIQTQRISTAELQRAACCNLSEAFETNASVDVAYTDAATGAKQIKLLGLSGSYVQMQVENIPGFRGVNAQYGLDYVPGPWMEGIQISKGAASVKNGFESMTGQINIEYKKSEHADPLILNLYAADNGRAEINLDGAHAFNEQLSTGLFMHYSNDKQVHDANKDGFIDRPKLEQFNLMNRWNYHKGAWVSHWGANILIDKRASGQANTDATSPPNLYTIGIENRYAEVYTKQGYMLDGENTSSMALILSGSFNDYKSEFGEYGYRAREGHLYAALLYESEFTVRHSLSTGVSLLSDLLDQQVLGFTLFSGNVPINNNQWVPGAYMEYTYKPLYNLTLLGGLRMDWHNRYGAFVTPRLHLKYDPIEWLHIRASAGKGFKNVNVLNAYHYLMASSRAQKITIEDHLPMEESLNYGLSATAFIPVLGKELMLSGELYHTRFLKQVVMDNETNPDAVSFYGLNGMSYADNFQLEMSYPIYTGLDFRAAYRLVNAKTTYAGVLLQQALQSRNKGFLTILYATSQSQDRWQFDYTLQINGSGRMPTPSRVQPLWDETFKSYTITHVQASRFFNWGSVYLGAENLFNFKQPNPIIAADDPYGSHFDATMIWGPIHGRSVYLGLRYIFK